MRKEYEEAKLEIIFLDSDVITDSNGDAGAGSGGVEGGGGQL